MGWTYISVKPWNKIEDIKAQHVREAAEYSTCDAKVIVHEWRRGVWFAIIKLTRPDGNVEKFLRVDLIREGKKEFGYKDLTEEMGPCNSTRPTRKFAKLIYEHIPVAKGYAKEWRDRNGVKYETM